MQEVEHIATVEVSKGGDGSFLAEVYWGEEVISGYGSSREEALLDALEGWKLSIKNPTVLEEDVAT